MSDATEPRATTPFPAEGAALAPPIGVDPLAGDWSEGLRGPVRALGIAEPRLLLLDGLPQPEANRAVSLPAVAPVAEVVEAPDAWGDPTEDPFQSAPPPSSELPSVIITFSEPPESASLPETAPAFFADATPPTPAPAFFADATPPTPAPAFFADATPATPAPAFFSDATLATPAPAFLPDASPLEDDGIVELGAEDAAEAVSADPSDAQDSSAWTADAHASDPAAWAGALGGAPAAEAPSPWSEPIAGQPPAAAEPAWKEAPMPMPGPAVAAVGAWDQVTAASPAVAWQMPPAHLEVAPEPAVDEAWSSPPPASEPVAEWEAGAPPGDWQEVKRPDPPAFEAPPAADWATLQQGPDWSSTPPAEAAPAEEGAWGSAPPPEAPSAWTAPAAAEEPSAWDPAAPAAPAPEWAAPVAPPAPSWHAAPAGASAMEQLDSEPPEVAATPGAAQELFGSVPLGASLSADENDLPEELGLPEELAAPEEFLKPVDLSDGDADLLVPVEEDEPPPPRPAQPFAALQPVGIGALWVQGEHRVAVHTRGGRTRRGTVKDVDLGKSQFSLVPQGGGAEEPVYHAEVKAVFFMLAPGEKPQPASGGKVRVTFADGRSVDGSRDGPEAKHGFFLVPADAVRTNTRRIYIAREATTDIRDG